MDVKAKETALRMIPYGLFILTSAGDEGVRSAATVNWVTQASFEPPSVAVGVQVDSFSFQVIESSRLFALNVLGRGQQDMAVNFFKTHTHEEGEIGGEPYHTGETGAPLLDRAVGHIECRVKEIFGVGDHSLVVGEVVEAHIAEMPAGRPDEVTLKLSDLEGEIFYGG